MEDQIGMWMRRSCDEGRERELTRQYSNYQVIEHISERIPLPSFITSSGIKLIGLAETGEFFSSGGTYNNQSTQNNSSSCEVFSCALGDQGQVGLTPAKPVSCSGLPHLHY